jgi:hypothetical protein
MSEYRPAFVARKGNPGFGWVVDVLWPDGETEVVKGFATEQQAAEWIAKHSEAGRARRFAWKARDRAGWFNKQSLTAQLAFVLAS